MNRDIQLYQNEKRAGFRFNRVLLSLMLLFSGGILLAQSPRTVMIQAGNSGETVMVRGFSLRIGTLRTSLDRDNASFLMVDGLYGEGVSFQYKKSPNYYLIADGNQLGLSYRKNNDWFRKMASFLIRKNGDGSVQIESVGKLGFRLVLSGSIPMISRESSSAAFFRLRSPEAGIDNNQVVEVLESTIGEPVGKSVSEVPDPVEKVWAPEKNEPSDSSETESGGSWIMDVLSIQAKAIKSLFTSDSDTKETEAEKQPKQRKEKAGAWDMEPAGDMVVPAVLAIPPMGEMAALNDFVDTGSITTTMNLLKELYGKLTPEQEATLEKQFAQYYEYPCDEVKEYFKKLNRELYGMLILKTRLSVEMGGYGHAAAEATNALAFKNEKMAEAASRHLLRRRKKILAIQRQFAEINMHLNTIGTPPNALEIKKKREKEFEGLLHLAFTEMGNKNSNNSLSPLDGVWEIDLNSEVIYAKSSPDNKTALCQKTTFAELDKTKTRGEDFYEKHYGKINKINDDVLIFFKSKKIYLKKIETLEHGFSYCYLYKYDEDTFENFVIREIDNSNFEIRPLSKHASDNYKLKLIVKQNHIDCCLEQFSGYADSDMISYKYKLFRKKTPSNPPTLTNGAWDWDELEDDFKDELNLYSKLSAKERNEFDLSEIEEDDDAIETIQWKIAVFKKFQSAYENFVSSYTGEIPSTIQKENLIWKLVNVEFTLPSPIYPYSITSSKSDGWVKVWKKTENSSSEPDNYIPDPDSEYDSNRTVNKRLVSMFSWNPPEKYYEVNQKWNINFQKSGSLKATLRMDNESISKNYIEFNPSEDSRDVILDCKYFYKIQGDCAVDKDFRISYKFKSYIKSPKNNFKKAKESSSEWASFDKEDFYNLQIQQLTEEIAEYRKRMGAATTAEEKKHYGWMILGKEADLQQQKDLLAELKTGEFRHTETRWDRVNAKISESRFLKESRVYQKKIHEFKYRMDMIRKIGGMAKKMKGQDELGVTRWANRQREQALKTKDNKKLAEIYAAVKKRYRQNMEQGIVDADQEIAFWDDAIEGAEYVKDKADTAFMIASTIQSGGAMYLYAGYTGLTNGISDGILSGVEHGLKSINMATMITGSAYDGYNAVDPRTGKKAGLKGAAENVGMTLVVLGVCHVGIKAAVKTCTVAKKAYSKYAFESALTAQERKMSLTMVRQYEAKLQKIEKMMRRGKKAAAREQAALMEKETTKLMANPHAKNYLKYNGSEITQRMYTRYENKVKEKVINRFKAEMEKKGWSKFNVKEFRNSASGDSLGMDWDLGLIEDKLKTMKINGKEVKVILKNGKPMTIGQFQNEAQKEFGKAYFKQTGYSAEGSFANLTTSVNKEAFADLNILKNPAMADKELAAETAKTVKYKAEFMLGKHSRGFVTKAGKMGEACRGLAKEIKTKLIPNLRQSKNTRKFLMDRVNGVDYFTRLQAVLQDFGKNKIGIVEAERSVRNLTGKSLNELPEFISSSVQKAIKAK